MSETDELYEATVDHLRDIGRNFDANSAALVQPEAEENKEAEAQKPRSTRALRT